MHRDGLARQPTEKPRASVVRGVVPQLVSNVSLLLKRKLTAKDYAMTRATVIETPNRRRTIAEPDNDFANVLEGPQAEYCALDERIPQPVEGSRQWEIRHLGVTAYS